MQRWDRIRGIHRPTPGVPARPAKQLRRALLGLAGEQDCWRVRDGRAECVHLVVELRVDEPQWAPWFIAQNLGLRAFRLRLRLDPQRSRLLAMSRIHHLRATPTAWLYARPDTVGGGPHGPVTEAQAGTHWVRDNGQWIRQFGTDRSLARLPLIATTTAHGWTWQRKNNL